MFEAVFEIYFVISYDLKNIFPMLLLLIDSHTAKYEYETVPYCLQLSQNWTLDCLLISAFLPVLTSFCMI